MQRAVLLLLLPLALAGCEEAVSRPPDVPDTPAPAPPTVRSCILHATGWADRAPVRLAVRDHGDVAVEIYGDPRDVTLQLGKSAHLDLRAGPVFLSGFVEPASLEIYATRPVPVGAALVLGPTRNLARDVRAWPHHASDDATVRIDAPAGIDLGQPVAAPVPCAALSLDRGSFDPLAGLRGKGEPVPASLKAGRRVVLRERPDGPELAKITLAANGEPVVVLEERGGARHVAFVRASLVIHGWAGADDVEPSTAPLSPLVTASTSADRFDAPQPKEERVCPHELSLQVLEPKGRAPQLLGRIPQDTKVSIVEWDHTFTKVFVQSAGIFPVEGASLVVPTKSFDGCRAP